MEESVKDYGWASAWHTDRAVLVVGGSTGIGAGIAAAFLGAGAQVTITGIAQAELDRAGAGPLGAADRLLLDVRDETAVRAVVEGLGGLHVLVNCAGIIRRGDELDPVVFAQVLDINLIGTMRCCAAARPALARSGSGAILNLASMLSIFGGGLVPGYAASKGGIAQLTKSLAIAYAGDGIRVNAVAPGWIETPLTQGLREDPARAGAILARTPLGRWGQPHDVAGAALFLCSPAAAFITGTILNVDGGYAAV